MAGPVCIQSSAIPSALSPNAVNGFSQLLNRQLPPALAASRSSRGARPRPPAGRAASTQSACVAAGSGSLSAQVSKLFVGTPGTEPARLSASLAAFHPRGQPPNGATGLVWVWSLPTGLPRAGPVWEGHQPALQTHGLALGGCDGCDRRVPSGAFARLQL